MFFIQNLPTFTDDEPKFSPEYVGSGDFQLINNRIVCGKVF